MVDLFELNSMESIEHGWKWPIFSPIWMQKKVILNMVDLFELNLMESIEHGWKWPIFSSISMKKKLFWTWLIYSNWI